MNVLFIGGTGIISSACSQLAVERGIDLYLLNRGSSLRAAPADAKIKQAVPGFAASIPYSLGVCEVMAWFDEDASRRKTDPSVDAKIDEIIERF